MTHHTDQPHNHTASDHDAVAGEFVMHSRLDAWAQADAQAMPAGLEARLVLVASEAAKSASTTTLAFDGVRHAANPRTTLPRRWRMSSPGIAAGLTLMVGLGLALVAKREGTLSVTDMASTSVAAAAQEAEDWALVTAVLGETPAIEMRDMWTHASSLDDGSKADPSSADLLTSEGSL